LSNDEQMNDGVGDADQFIDLCFEETSRYLDEISGSKDRHLGLCLELPPLFSPNATVSFPKVYSFRHTYVHINSLIKRIYIAPLQGRTTQIRSQLQHYQVKPP